MDAFAIWLVRYCDSKAAMRSIDKRNITEFWRFSGAGIINTAIGYAIILFFMKILDQPILISNAAGYILGLPISYLTHRSISFRAAGLHLRSFVRYVIGFGLAYGVNVLLLIFFSGVANIRDDVSQFLAVVGYVLVFFQLNRSWIHS